MSGDDKKLVFVSYAHKDRAFLDREVMPFLRQLELGEQIELWEDQLIGTGDNWYAEIADRLDQAKVAVLIVTPAFLGSKFCQHEEVPVLLQRARRRELRVMPLLAKPCLWDNEPWLKRTQMWPTDGTALNKRSEAIRNERVTEFARRVRDAVDTPGEAGEGEGRFDKPDDTHDLHRMPQTGSLLFGRRKELKLLDEAWDKGDTNLIAFTAAGGVGKSTLVRVWAEMLAEDAWRGAERAFAWSFYSQGTGRMTDAEGFINEALMWFGDDTPEKLSPWDRGTLLAEWVRKRRTLLILDGVEPLQSGEKGVDKGSIRDPGLRTLVEELAKENPGLCVVTTREPLADLLGGDLPEFAEPALIHQDLDQVSTLSGRALLRVARIQGKDEELETAVRDLGGHALAVSLLGSLLTYESPAPHIANAKELPPLTYSVEKGGHPRRVLDAWAKRLGEGPELELLHIIGLFDRPAARSAVQSVINGVPVRSLNKHLSNAKLDDILDRVRRTRLLARQSTHEDTIDTHPIVREHFGQRLEAQNKKSWREGHRQLYEHFKKGAKHHPDDLAGMQPLFAAVVHGCSAGLYEPDCLDVYYERILRGQDDYLVKTLGAFAAELSCLSHFFAKRWDRPEPILTGSAQSWVIANAGFLLRGMGRLREAVGSTEEALRRGIAADDWEAASIRAGNLSELFLILGELAQAEARARDAVDYADQAGVTAQRMITRTTHADALHQLGQTARARSLFVEAEQMQAKMQPDYPLLYSVWGYKYSDLLIAEGEADEVLQRAELFIECRMPSDSLLDIALDNLSLGRAYMATTEAHSYEAEEHLQSALDGLRTSGSADQLPLGLLARAEFYSRQNELGLARHDLDEVRAIVRRTGMRLYEADLELEQTRWHIASDDLDAARESLAKSKNLVEEMDYGRRHPEVEELEAELED